MTEIPEHLLKRSRDRRSALGLGGDGSGDAAAPAAESAPAAGAATPATASSSTPAPAAAMSPAARKAAAAAAAAPPPKPDSAVVAAYKERKRIPYWAMFALSLMPIWAFMYVRSMTEGPVEATGPMAAGAEVYASSCASCHGADGGGGAGYKLSEGESEKTFAHIEDQIRFVYFGTTNYQLAGIDIYGDPNREGGPHRTGDLGMMPGWGPDAGGSLTDIQILEVVCHERFGMPGSPSHTEGEFAAEYELWCSEESPVFAALEAGTSLATIHEAGIEAGPDEPIKLIGDQPYPVS